MPATRHGSVSPLNCCCSNRFRARSNCWQAATCSTTHSRTSAQINGGHCRPSRSPSELTTWTSRSLAGGETRNGSTIPSVELLNLPPVVLETSARPRGLVLVTGPTGSGKTTTLAALLDHINHTRSEHILTIEDPIEFVYQSDKSLVHQRQLNQNTRPQFRQRLARGPAGRPARDPGRRDGVSRDDSTSRQCC